MKTKASTNYVWALEVADERGYVVDTEYYQNLSEITTLSAGTDRRYGMYGGDVAEYHYELSLERTQNSSTGSITSKAWAYIAMHPQGTWKFYGNMLTAANQFECAVPTRYQQELTRNLKRLMAMPRTHAGHAV